MAAAELDVVGKQTCTQHPRYSTAECGSPAAWAVGHHGARRVVCEPCLERMLDGGFWCNVCAVSVVPDDMVWVAL